MLFFEFDLLNATGIILSCCFLLCKGKLWRWTIWIYRTPKPVTAESECWELSKYSAWEFAQKYYQLVIETICLPFRPLDQKSAILEIIWTFDLKLWNLLNWPLQQTKIKKKKKKFKKTFIEQPVENMAGILIKLKRKVKLEMAM